MWVLHYRSGKSIQEIEEAEKLLGIKFSKQYRDFNEKYGYLSFYGNEIFGIDTNNLGELEGNSLAYALNDRKEYNRHIIFSRFIITMMGIWLILIILLSMMRENLEL